jgi:NAD(P)H dehydrogenase (quinone)
MFGVVGVSGRTGRVVADALLAHGSEVRAIMRSEAPGADWRSRGAEVVLASLEDADALGLALSKLAGLYVILPEDPRRPDFHAPRRRMAAAIASAVERSRVPHVVVLSAFPAALADGNGPTKDLHLLEESLLRTGCVLTTLRASYFQDNVAMALEPARRQGVFPTLAAAPSVRFPTVATRDVGRAAAGCLLEPPARSETVGLAGPAYSVDETAALLGKALGRTLQIVPIPREAQVETLVANGLSRELAMALAEMQACVESRRVPFHADRWVDCPTRLEQVIDELVS